MIDVQIRRVNDHNVAAGRRQYGTIKGTHAIIVAHARAAANAVCVGGLMGRDCRGLNPRRSGETSLKTDVQGLLVERIAAASENGSDRRQALAVAPAAGWMLKDSERALDMALAPTMSCVRMPTFGWKAQPKPSCALLDRAPASAEDSRHSHHA
jgi:hypothetical protein